MRCVRVALLLFLITRCAAVAAPPLERSTPEAQGVSSSAILGFLDAAEDSIDALHSIMILRHGRVVAEGWWSPYNADSPHRLFSLSKSFTSTAVGLAVEEGLLSLDDPLIDHFPDVAPPEPSDNLKAMRIRDLLRMNTGHLQADADSFWSFTRNTWAASFLAVPVSLKPGTHFLYNTGGSYMLSATVQQRSGMTILDYLTPRLFEPLGIEGATWRTNDEGVNVGGWGLKIRTEDIARFGQLYLQKGMWNGRRLLSEDWVEAATARQTSNGSNPDSDWDQGYGYQFWRCRHNIYRGDGAFGQYCIVMPDQDAVIAITSGVADMQVVLDLVWDRLLPAMADGPLPSLDTGPLSRRLRDLSLSPQQGRSSSSLASDMSGKTFVFAANERGLQSVSLDFEETGAIVTIVDTAGAGQPIAVGYDEWKLGATTFDSDESQPVAASGAWIDDGKYAVRLCFYESPYRPSLTFSFADGQLLLDVAYNVGFGLTEWEQLVAQTE